MRGVREQDLERLPDYKLYVFLDAFAFNDAEGALVRKKLARGGNALRQDLRALTSGPDENTVWPRAKRGRKTGAPSTA